MLAGEMEDMDLTRRNDSSSDGASGRDRLKEFQDKMAELDDLFHDPAQAEFCIVTIPTELAVAETERLVKSLKHEGMLVRRLIVNQVFSVDADEDDGQKFASLSEYAQRFIEGQSSKVDEINQLARERGVGVVYVPYFDRQVSGYACLLDIALSECPFQIDAIQGLRRVGHALFTG
mmetsp:Transcript_13595/g.39219  ORF Transcript_13595/g.39219 Transcript_13595/m.39219 type:complete len:176 (+) Transcript_13595:2076-2603(+)